MPRKDAFRRASEDYLEFIRKTRSSNTYTTYRKTLAQIHRAIRSAGVTTYISRWGPEDVMDILSQMGHLLPSTRRFRLTVLRQMLLHAGLTVLDQAIRKGVITMPRRSRVNVRWYGEEDLALFLAMARDDVDYVILVLASELGLRRAEITSVLLTDIRGDVLIVRGKGEKYVPLPLTERVWTTLERWIYVRQDLVMRALRRNPAQEVPEELLIYSRGGVLRPYAPSSVETRLRKIGRAVGKPLSAHDLRRSCGREVYLATHDLVAVNRLLRHEDLNQTREYIGADIEDARAALSARERKRASIAPKTAEPVYVTR